MLCAMTRYEFALEAHSTLRLALTVCCGWLVLVALRGMLGSKDTKLSGNLTIRLAIFAADAQLILGLLLYFLWSPTTQQARADFGAAMKDPTLRFWAVEHGTAMVLVIACVHIGKVLVKRAGNESTRYRHMLVFFGIALALILFASPWPFSSIARPIWPFGHTG